MSDQNGETSAALVPVQVRDLSLRIPTRKGHRPAWVHAATGVTLDVPAGSLTVLAGESGSGKTMLASALCGLLPTGTEATGQIWIDGRERLGAAQRHWRGLRGRVIGLASQSGATSFTPVRLIGPQLQEVITALASDVEVDQLLMQVGLPASTADQFPHELSGGMAQRVALAAALAGKPAVLIADEPTAGLDPELAQRILHVLRRAADSGAAVLVITHDLQAIETTGIADRIAVMYAGRIVESGFAEEVLSRPQHAYTAALLAALPSRGLHPIPGLPPELTDLDPDYEFEDRLRSAQKDG